MRHTFRSIWHLNIIMTAFQTHYDEYSSGGPIANPRVCIIAWSRGHMVKRARCHTLGMSFKKLYIASGCYCIEEIQTNLQQLSPH